jgi:hypothetical protein
MARTSGPFLCTKQWLRDSTEQVKNLSSGLTQGGPDNRQVGLPIATSMQVVSRGFISNGQAADETV